MVHMIKIEVQPHGRGCADYRFAIHCDKLAAVEQLHMFDIVHRLEALDVRKSGKANSL